MVEKRLRIAAGAAVAVIALPAFAQDRVLGGVVFQSDTFMQTLQEGMQAAADEAGVQLILGNSETDLAKEASIVDDMLVRGIDALVISPFAADGSAAALGRVAEAGVPIVCANSCLTNAAGVASFFQTRNVDLGTTTGEAAAAYINETLDGTAVIGILNCDTFPEACLPRKEGFLQALTDAGVTYEVAADQTGYLADQALPVAEAMLQANPGINLLWGANEGGTVAHVLAVQGAGLGSKVAVFGTDMTGQMAEFLTTEGNALQAVTGQAPYQMGYDAVNAALAVLDGGEVAADATIPTILFQRGDAERIATFVETDGRALFGD